MKIGGLGLFLIGPRDKAISNIIVHKSVALYSPDYLRGILSPDYQTLNTLLPLNTLWNLGITRMRLLILCIQVTVKSLP